MKFEFEIEDKVLHEFVTRAAINLERKTSVGYGLHRLIENEVTQAVTRTDFGPEIAEAIRARASLEIDRAVDEKLPGWIKRQVKEMLKLARLMGQGGDE